MLKEKKSPRFWYDLRTDIFGPIHVQHTNLAFPSGELMQSNGQVGPSDGICQITLVSTRDVQSGVSCKDRAY